jgi:hypothetical protein
MICIIQYSTVLKLGRRRRRNTGRLFLFSARVWYYRTRTVLQHFVSVSASPSLSLPRHEWLSRPAVGEPPHPPHTCHQLVVLLMTAHALWCTSCRARAIVQQSNRCSRAITSLLWLWSRPPGSRALAVAAVGHDTLAAGRGRPVRLLCCCCCCCCQCMGKRRGRVLSRARAYRDVEKPPPRYHSRHLKGAGFKGVAL